MFDDVATVAWWRLGGREMLRTLAKALAADDEDVAAGCAYALKNCMCNTTAQEVAEVLVAQPGAISRLLQQHVGAVRAWGGGAGAGA